MDINLEKNIAAVDGDCLDVSNVRQHSKVHLIFSLKNNNFALAVSLCQYGERFIQIGEAKMIGIQRFTILEFLKSKSAVISGLSSLLRFSNLPPGSTSCSSTRLSSKLKLLLKT